VIVIEDEPKKEAGRRQDEPFFVGGYDPGTKAGALVRVNLTDGRVIEGTPVSLSELKKSGKHHDKEPTYGELSYCLRVLMKSHEYRRYFQRVVIEKQKGGKLQTVEVALATALGSKATISNMRSVRNHYNISVSAHDMKSRSRKGREDQAYEKRKRLTIKMVEECDESPLQDDDLEMLFELASVYWEERAERYGITSKGVLNVKIRKAYSDLVEAAVHALFPGNWGAYVDKELKMHNASVPKLSPTLSRAHKQRAKALMGLFGVDFSRAESRFLPLRALRHYVAFAIDDRLQKKTRTARSAVKTRGRKKPAVSSRKRKKAPSKMPSGFRQKKLTLSSLMPVNHLLPR